MKVKVHRVYSTVCVDVIHVWLFLYMRARARYKTNSKRCVCVCAYHCVCVIWHLAVVTNCGAIYHHHQRNCIIGCLHLLGGSHLCIMYIHTLRGSQS